jgi:G5 domain
MSGVMVFVFLIAFSLMIWSFFSAKPVSKLARRSLTRKRATTYAFIATILTFIGVGITAPPTPDAPRESQQVLSSNKTVASPELQNETPAPEIVEEISEVPYTTESVNDNTILKGQQSVAVAGKNGVKTHRYEITKDSDKIVSKKLVSEAVTTQPINQVIHVGTKEVATQTQSSVSSAPSPQPTASSSSAGIVKKSRTSICHAPGTTYYSRTTNFTPYNSIEECLSSGGRLPKQ